MESREPRGYAPVKTPTVLQMEAAECGAAALGIILEYHGRYVPLDVLRDDCGVSRDGSNALYMKEAAKRYGLEVKAFRKPAAGLSTRRPPFIVFWQWNHFLVVEGFRRGWVFINDPASGRRSIGFEEFERGYSGIAFTFEKGPRFKREGHRPSTLVGLFRRLSTSRRALGFVILAGIALVIPTLIAAAFQRVFIDEILVGGHRGWLKPLLWAMALSAVLRLAASGLEKVYLTRLEIKLALGESLWFLWHVLRLPVSFFQHRFTGDIVGRAASTARVASLISGELATTTVSLITLVFYVAVMLPYDPFLTLVGVGISSVNLLALQAFNRVKVDGNRAVEQIRGRLMASVMWAIQIIESIKASGCESDLLVRWAGDQARIINAEQSLGVYNALLIVIPPFLSSLTSIVILGLGGGQVILGSLSIGTLVAFQALLVGFNQPFHDLARLGGEIQELRADLDRIDDVRNRAVDPLFAAPALRRAGAGDPARGSVAQRLSGHLEFRKVTFGYSRTVEEPLIKDLSFVARPGQRIALVGGSGSGKSTIGRLAAGLYHPWSGEVLHDGRLLSQIPREVFIHSVGVVDADISLFEGTVRDNLTLWDEMVRGERLVQAGVDAAIHRDILERRGGYDAIVDERARNFSGGQRQRLQIARALVRDPSLLILDEATSALDPKTERTVDDNLRRRGVTCLIIAHRLTTIRDCDEIIVLAGGRVVERGAHEQLIANAGGEYSRLISHQVLPGPSRGSFSLTRRRLTSLAVEPPRPVLAPMVAATDRAVGPQLAGAAHKESERPRFIVEELFPYSRPERTAANLPLALDDPEAVWWVSSGGVDVFFSQLGPDDQPGRRRHLCRVEEGGSIFAISGVRGRSGGGLVAVGAGPAQLLKFSRGELIRLSFEEGLADQVAVLVDDWVARVGQAIGRYATIEVCKALELNQATEIAGGVPYRVRQGVAWVRHHQGASALVARSPIALSENSTRFPISEDLWLRALAPSVVSACDTASMIRQGDPWAGLDCFHRTILDFISAIDDHETDRRWAELERSITHDRAMLESVASRLAAAANSATAVAVQAGDDALLRACRAVAAAGGTEVRSPCPSDDRPSDPARDPLGDIARASGFHARQVTLGRDWWRSRGGEPLLGRLTEAGQTPVALLPTGSLAAGWGPAYMLHTPDGGHQPIDAAVSRRISHSAWVFYPSLPDAPLSIAALFQFARRLRGLGRELAITLALALLGALLGLMIPVAFGIMVDQVIPAADLPRLAVVCGFLLVLSTAGSIFQAIQWLTALRVEGRIAATLIPAVWDRLLRLPSGFFARYSSGDLALRAMGLAEIFKKLSGAVVSTVVTGMFSFFNLALLFYYSWKLALCTTLLLALMFTVTAMLLSGLLRQETAIRRVDGSISGLLLELLGNIIALRTSGAESRAFSRWARLYTERLTRSIAGRRIANRIYQWLAVYPIATSMVVYFGAIHFDQELMKTGAFLAFTITFSNLMAAALAVGYTSISLLELLPMFDRIKPILEERPEFPAAIAEPVRLTGALALNHISFRYPGQDVETKVLDDVSLQVRAGEFVAIVGPSGAGKSTLIRLLLGFEAPGAGTITYDGRELPTLDLRDLRRQIGVVLQNAHLMPSDIFSNVVGFAPFLTLDDAWQAVRLAGLEEDIRAMPMGMNTLVGEAGGNLSSGQRQRLLIARAIVARPRILLLDEATSALDNVTQAIVSETLTNQLQGITRVVIAHRLDAIVKADRIYVLKDSRIVQSGRYHQLLEEPGAFRELARRQML